MKFTSVLTQTVTSFKTVTLFHVIWTKQIRFFQIRSGPLSYVFLETFHIYITFSYISDNTAGYEFMCFFKRLTAVQMHILPIVISQCWKFHMCWTSMNLLKNHSCAICFFQFGPKRSFFIDAQHMWNFISSFCEFLLDCELPTLTEYNRQYVHLHNCETFKKNT